MYFLLPQCSWFSFAIERFVRLQKQFVTVGLADKARSLVADGQREELVTLCQKEQSGLARGIEAITPYLTIRR